jgi:hypothetical protein
VSTLALLGGVEPEVLRILQIEPRGSMERIIVVFRRLALLVNGIPLERARVDHDQALALERDSASSTRAPRTGS